MVVADLEDVNLHETHGFKNDEIYSSSLSITLKSECQRKRQRTTQSHVYEWNLRDFNFSII